MTSLFQNPLSVYVVGVLGLFGIGLYGLLATRNMIKMVAVLQILVKIGGLGPGPGWKSQWKYKLRPKPGSDGDCCRYHRSCHRPGAGRADPTPLWDCRSERNLYFEGVSMAPILILAIIGLPWLGALCVWLIGDQRPRTQHILAAGFSVAAGLVALILLGFVSADTVIRIPVGNFFGELTFVADGLGAFLAVVATVVGSLAVIFSIDYMHGEEQLGRYYALVLFFIGSMAGLVLTSSMFFLFVFWEMTALCSYGLISFYNDDPKAVAGGIKALIITQVGGVGLLAGALVAYAQHRQL